MSSRPAHPAAEVGKMDKKNTLSQTPKWRSEWSKHLVLLVQLVKGGVVNTALGLLLLYDYNNLAILDYIYIRFIFL